MPISLRPIARRALAAQSDDRLVRLLREGHEPAFDEIVRRYRGPLVTFAAAIAGAGRAEDVVQTALMRAHRALRADAREIRLRPWLFAIVRNGALNAVRDEPAWSELDPERQGDRETAATAEQREELERLVDAVCALPESQRRALVMREMEGVGHAEIAAKLQTSPTAVRGLIFRARTTLRNALGALVPLPVLRWLLEDAAIAATAGAAGTGGAGVGVVGTGGGALFGGAFGKAAVGLTVALFAVGAGKAIQDRRDGGDRDEAGPETARAATGAAAGERDNGGRGTAADRGRAAAERREPRHEGAEERREHREAAGENDREDRGDGHGDRDDGHEDRGDDTRAGGTAEDHGGHSGAGSSGASTGGGSGHPAGGGSDDHDDEIDEIDDDDRAEPEEPEEPEEPDIDDSDDDEVHPTPSRDDGDDD